LVLGIGAIGCSTPTLPNPNDPNAPGAVRSSVLRKNLAQAYRMLEDRRMRGEITEEDVRKRLRAYASTLLAGIDLGTIDPLRAWEYGEIARTAERWEDAKRLYQVATSVARTDDRRVNDGLRLAEALAHLGEVPDAIEAARAVFDAPPRERAPILPAVLYEIVPAGRARGSDLPLARLLVDAIERHETTLVDPSREAGRAFLSARTRHIDRAWALVFELAESAGDDKLSRRALAARARLVSSYPRV
jgi:tetratricopeptide (TPR) repeat protein